MLTEPSIIALIFAVYLLAGTVKGTIGLGFPVITIGLLTATIGLREAIALSLIPALMTNVWQVIVTGQLVPVTKRLWPFLGLGVVTCAMAAAFALSINTELLTPVLGLVLVLYAGSTLAGFAIPTPSADREKPLSAAIGAFNGVVAGVTGIYSVPSAAWFSSIDLPREQFIQAVGTWFMLCSVILIAAYGTGGGLTGEIALISVIGLIPSFAGMTIGQRLRRLLDEKRFRLIVLVALLLLGLNLMVRSVLG